MTIKPPKAGFGAFLFTRTPRHPVSATPGGGLADTEKVRFNYLKCYLTSIENIFRPSTIRPRLRDTISVPEPLVNTSRSILPILVALVVPASSLATTLIGVRQPGVMVISIDSYVRDSGASGRACKIYKTGSTYFAIAGLYRDSNRSFDVRTLVAEGLSSTNQQLHSRQKFQAEVSNVERLVNAALQIELNQTEKENPVAFAETEKTPEPVSILLATIRNGVPCAASLGFQVMAPSPKITKVVRHACPGDCPDGHAVFYFGVTSDVRDYLKNPNSSLLEPPLLASTLVGIGIKENPAEVSGPITTLELSKNGVKWISNEVGCPVIVPAPSSQQ